MTNIDKEREAFEAKVVEISEQIWAKVFIENYGMQNQMIIFANAIAELARAKQHSGEAVGYRVSWNDKFRGCGEILYTLKEFEEYSHVEIAKNHACLIENKIEKLFLSPQQPQDVAVNANKFTPFSNCQFELCDLPGQCKDAGRCHHPVSVGDIRANYLLGYHNALEMAAELIISSIDSIGDQHSYNGTDLSCCEHERISTVQMCEEIIRNLINQPTQG